MQNAVSYAIQIENLEKTFSNGKGLIRAVDGLNLKVQEGELYGLLGPNGAGKSTTINIMCGLLSLTEGMVIIGGFDVMKFPIEVKKRIGVCPQEPSVFSYMTGRQNIELFGNLHAVSKNQLKIRIPEILEKIGLMSDADRAVKQYSGGMVRRINIAMALISDPDIIFLDEPTVAMDPQSRHAVWDFIKELKHKGKPVILTTHYIEEAESLCDRVGIIDQGKLIAEGTPAALKSIHNAKSLEDVFIMLTGRKIRESN